MIKKINPIDLWAWGITPTLFIIAIILKNL